MLLGPPPALAQLPAPDDSGEALIDEGLGWVDWAVASGIIVAGIVLAMVARHLVRRGLTATQTPVAVRRILARLVGGAVFGVAVIYALGRLGVRIGPLLGAAGIIGIALAFALQDILENLIAGVMLQARRPFSIGDQIASNDYEGTVEDVNTRATVIRTFDGRQVFLPNALVLKNVLENRTAYEKRRTTVAVGVAYGCDLPHAAEVISDAVSGARGVAKDPPCEVYLEALGASSIDFAVRFWHDPTISEEWQTRHEVVLGTYDALDAAGIEIPFPQQTLHIAELERIASLAREPSGRHSNSANRSD